MFPFSRLTSSTDNVDDDVQRTALRTQCIRRWRLNVETGRSFPSHWTALDELLAAENRLLHSSFSSVLVAAGPHGSATNLKLSNPLSLLGGEYLRKTVSGGHVSGVSQVAEEHRQLWHNDDQFQRQEPLRFGILKLFFTFFTLMVTN